MKSIALLILIVTCGTTYAQLNYDANFGGPGAKAESMGGAFIAAENDVTTLGWNPAGLNQIDLPEISFSTKFSADEFIDRERSEKGNWTHSQMNFIGLAYPVNWKNKKVVFAAGYQRQVDFYSQSKTRDTYTPNLFKGTNNKGGIDNISIAMSSAINEIVSVGASSSFWFGKPNTKYIYYQYSNSIETEKYSLSGFNFSLGILIDIHRMISLPMRAGIIFRSPFKLKGHYSTNYLNNPPAKEQLSVQVPYMVGFGISYHWTKNLTTNFDYTMNAFGRSKANYDGFKVPVSESRKNLNQFRFGTEYILGFFAFRGGLKTIPTLIADTDFNEFVTKKQVIGYAYTGGIGIIKERFSLDISLTHSIIKRNREQRETEKFYSNSINVSGCLNF